MYFMNFCILSMLVAMATATARNNGAMSPVGSNLKPQLLSSCDDAFSDGVYQIKLPGSSLSPFFVYCHIDWEDGRPWTIVQRRQDGSQNFYRNWQDYKHGFGNLFGEFFIGLDKLEALTNSKPHELSIKLMNKVNETRYANYSLFAIGDENTQYSLNVLGKYSGNAGDSLTHHAGRKFTTKDSNNSLDSGDNCAVKYTGAWWYVNCHISNLNGKYNDDTFGKGINWHSWTGFTYSLKYAHMAIRPKRN